MEREVLYKTDYGLHFPMKTIKDLATILVKLNKIVHDARYKTMKNPKQFKNRFYFELIETRIFDILLMIFT